MGSPRTVQPHAFFMSRATAKQAARRIPKAALKNIKIWAPCSAGWTSWAPWAAVPGCSGSCPAAATSQPARQLPWGGSPEFPTRYKRCPENLALIATPHSCLSTLQIHVLRPERACRSLLRCAQTHSQLALAPRGFHARTVMHSARRNAASLPHTHSDA